MYHTQFDFLNQLCRLVLIYKLDRLSRSVKDSYLIIDELVRRINNIEEGIIFIEIPLLYECKLEYLCDKIICVYLAKDIQVKRLMARDGIDEAYANLKIDSQMDLNIKKSLADFVVDTSKEYIEIEQQILEIIKKIKGENLWQQ